MKKQKWIERDMRKLRANPSRLVTELKKLDWTFITERPFSCTHCDNKMPPNMRQLVEKKAFRCSQCDKTFENECNVDELAEPYKCTHCGSNFSPNMSIITEEKAFSCPQCERTFSNKCNTDDLVVHWSKNVIQVLDLLAAKKERSIAKKRKIELPVFVKEKLQKLKEMREELDAAERAGCVDKEMVKKYNKHKNFCSRLQKKVIAEKRGNNITPKSTMNQIWKELCIALRPERFANNQMRLVINGEITEDPKVIAEAFVDFFKKKVDDLVIAIKSDPNYDPLEPLGEKYENRDLKFSFKPVDTQTVTRIIKDQKVSQ